MKAPTLTDIYRGVIFLAALLIVSLLWDEPIACFAILVILFIEMNRSLRWRYLKTSLLSGFLGPLAEAVAIAFNAWQYTFPQTLGVTLWLFPLWGVASLFFIALSVFLGEQSGVSG